MERRSSCCSGRSYATTSTLTAPKKEPTVSPKKESDVKPVAVDLKKEAKEISSLKVDQGLPQPAAVKKEEKVNVTVIPTVTTLKKEPTLSPKKESDVKPVAVDLKKEAKEISSPKVDQGLPQPAPVKKEEKVNVNVGCGGGRCWD